MTKRLGLLAVTLVLSACASTPEPVVTNPAVEDFIIANELEPLPSIRTRDRDVWKALNTRYIIYRTRKQAYLIEFKFNCRNLTKNYTEGADMRVEQRKLRARADTIRGCYIGEIYAITPDQRIELQNLGEAPGLPS